MMTQMKKRRRTKKMEMKTRKNRKLGLKTSINNKLNTKMFKSTTSSRRVNMNSKRRPNRRPPIRKLKYNKSRSKKRRKEFPPNNKKIHRMPL